MNKEIKKYLFFLLKLFFIFIILIEFFSFLTTKLQIIPINDTPYKYNGSNFRDLRTEENIWGAWHKENKTVKHNAKCINATYTTNSVGAKDDNFLIKKDKKKRVVLLGDSFAESYGLDNEQSFDSELERLSNFDIYNFGFSGSAGPLQYYLIYENLAKKYEHDSLIIFFLPSNDFTDNDYSLWKKRGWETWEKNKVRYRPYYKKTKNGFEYFIPKNATKRRDWQFANERSLKSIIKDFANNYLWTMNVYKSFAYIRSYKQIKNDKKRYSGFFDATLEQQNSAIYFLKKIVTSKKFDFIRIVIFPSGEDLKRINELPSDSLENQNWFKELQKIPLEINNDDFKIINIADYVDNEKDYKQYLHGCDQHLSYKGVTYFSKIINDNINGN
jgi:hypothetical protein